MLEEKIEQIPVLILGASAAAVGMASVLKEKCIIVEKTCRLPSEYVDAFAGNRNDKSEDICDTTKAIIMELTRRGVYRESALYLPAISPILFAHIKEEKLNRKFLTRILKVEKDSKGYQITLHNASRITEMHTSCIIDTTAYCESLPYDNNRIQSKSLNAYLITQKEEVLPTSLQQEEAIIERGYYNRQLLLRYPLAPEDDWIQARKLF